MISLFLDFLNSISDLNTCFFWDIVEKINNSKIIFLKLDIFQSIWCLGYELYRGSTLVSTETLWCTCGTSDLTLLLIGSTPIIEPVELPSSSLGWFCQWYPLFTFHGKFQEVKCVVWCVGHLHHFKFLPVWGDCWRHCLDPISHQS